MAGAKGIQGKDLETLNLLYNHEKSYKEKQQEMPNDDLRSLKSEYDYGAKKKFVDVLGNIKKNNDGLKGLDSLRNHPGAKNLDEQTHRSMRSNKSKFSVATSARRRFNNSLVEKNKDVDAI
jgi:hypothetical protein